METHAENPSPAEDVRSLTAKGSTVEGDGWRVVRGRTKWEWWVRGDNEWHFIDDFATKKAAIAAAVAPPPDDVRCPHVCPNRPGRGHEWYLRTSDRLRFCRDCGFDWVPLPAPSDGDG